jgi:ubiquitin-protein ligase
MPPIKQAYGYEAVNYILPILQESNWRPTCRIKDVLERLFDMLYKKTLKDDLQDLRNEALVNDTIRNILVNEDNLYEWKFSIFPTDVPFNVASFGISIQFPGKCL